MGGNWTEPDTIEPTSSPALNDYIGWPSVGIAENNDIYIAFTQPVSLKQEQRFGIGPVYYTKIIPDSNIYNIERILVSSDSVSCYHPHIVYNVPLSVSSPGPSICWCQGQEVVSIYYRHMPPILTGIEETENYQFSISNYQLSVCPNPFTTSTTISLLPSAQEHKNTGAQDKTMELNIYDVSGRLVRNLVTGDLCSGALMWDGKDDEGNRVKSGVYFVKLKVGKRMMSRKVIFLK